MSYSAHTTVDKSKDVTGDGVRDSVITETSFDGTRGETIAEAERQFVDKNKNLTKDRDDEKVILEELREGKDDDGDLELQDKEVDTKEIPAIDAIHAVHPGKKQMYKLSCNSNYTSWVWDFMHKIHGVVGDDEKKRKLSNY